MKALLNPITENDVVSYCFHPLFLVNNCWKEQFVAAQRKENGEGLNQTIVDDVANFDSDDNDEMIKCLYGEVSGSGSDMT